MNKLKQIGLFLISVQIIVSCESTSTIGEDLVQSEIVDIVFTDTSTINMSTVLFDSISTTNTLRYLIGYHEDQELGAIESQAFFKLGTDSLSTAPSDDASYSYAELVLRYDGYHYYDTNQTINLSLYQLTELLEPREDELFYNVDEYTHDLTPLVSFDFEPRPFNNSEITILLDDNLFGQNLLTEMQDYLNFLENYEDILQGFVLKTNGTTSGAFIGFSSNSYISIHYREGDEDLELILSGSNEDHFNRITSDRSSTVIADLEGGTSSLLSTESGNMSFLQGGVAIGFKIDLPGVQNMLEIIDPAYIIDAKLYLKPIKNSYGSYTPLTESMTIYQADKLNRIVGVTDLDLTLEIDQEFGEDTQYEIDIFPYVQSKLYSETIDTDVLLFTPLSTDWGKTVDRIYLGDQANTYRASVKIFLLDYITN